ncbi:MAG TPA: YheV family putative zinc ribbon protein [Pseudomonadales bacterium]|nr:YheV family putative zinc ribbon protein [Pseudomonadales bacterium]
MADAPRKRFIAGAVCPRCGEQDRIRSWDEDDRQMRECIDCGFSDVMKLTSESELPSGRLDAPRPRPEDKAQPIRFYPRPPKDAD